MFQRTIDLINRRAAELNAQAAREQAERDRRNAENRARYLADLEAREEAQRRAREQAEAVRRETEAARIKESARSAFLQQAGATNEDFERLWPSMRDEMLKREAIEAAEQAQASLLASMQYETL